MSLKTFDEKKLEGKTRRTKLPRALRKLTPRVRSYADKARSKRQKNDKQYMLDL